MQLSKDYKLERIDSMNIALKKRFKGNQWNPIRFWRKWERAIPEALEHITLDKVNLSGDLSEVVRALKNIENTLDIFSKRLSLTIDSGNSKPKPRKRNFKSVSVRNDIYFELKEISKNLNLSIASFVNELILKYLLEEKQAPAPTQLSKREPFEKKNINQKHE